MMVMVETVHEEDVVLWIHGNCEGLWEDECAAVVVDEGQGLHLFRRAGHFSRSQFSRIRSSLTEYKQTRAERRVLHLAECYSLVVVVDVTDDAGVAAEAATVDEPRWWWNEREK